LISFFFGKTKLYKRTRWRTSESVYNFSFVITIIKYNSAVTYAACFLKVYFIGALLIKEVIILALKIPLFVYKQSLSLSLSLSHRKVKTEKFNKNTTKGENENLRWSQIKMIHLNWKRHVTLKL